MNDEEIGGLLKLAFLTRESRQKDIELAESDAILDLEEFRETSLRLRKRFVAELFREKHSDLIREVDTKVPLGIWLATERDSLRLDCQEMANALDITPDTLAGLERGRIKPWEISVTACFQIMELLRLHFESLAVLVRNTATTANMLGVNSAQARCHGGKMTDARSNAVAKALEMFKAHNSDPIRDQRAEDWLGSVRTYLLASHDDFVD